MQIIGSLFNTIFFAPVVNVLVLLVSSVQSLGMPGALGLSIVLVTIIIKLLTWPLNMQQLRSAKKMNELKPHLDELKKKHKGDKKSFASAQADLFKQHGYNPAAGCLPTLLQIPILIALYQAISSMFNGASGLEHINYFLYPFVEKLQQAPSPYFLGFDLAAKPSDFMSIGWVVLLVPIVTALLTFIQSKMMAPVSVKPYPSDSPKEKGEKKKEEDAMSAVSTQMMYMMPVMIGYFAFSFPIGLSVYWNTFSLLGIYQQYQVTGWGGLGGLIEKVSLFKMRRLR